MTDPILLRVHEEETSTPIRLLGIGMFAAFGFLLMAVFSDASTRAVPLVVGGLIVAMLAAVGGWMVFQQRYGTATLMASTPFGKGEFRGVIETELKSVPNAPVMLRIVGYERSSEYVTLSVQEEVPPARMRKNEYGSVLIPFSMQIPHGDAVGVRFTVRTTSWPIGWGATFVLVPSGAERLFG